MDRPKTIRLLILGDASVGKSTLVSQLCDSTCGKRTIGCSLKVLQHSNTPTTSFFVELIDVSGNCQNLESRRAFYRNVDGVVLVHSTANSKSHANLSRWILPFLDYAGEKLSSTSQSFKVQIGSNSTNTDIPILVVGTRIDESRNHHFRSSVAQQYGGDSILMNATNPISAAVYSQFAQFFDGVYSLKIRNRN